MGSLGLWETAKAGLGWAGCQPLVPPAPGCRRPCAHWNARLCDSVTPAGSLARAVVGVKPAG